MEFIEVTADTVDEAVANGLQQLGVSASDVMVEVLEEPSRGLLGIGAKPARVKLVLLGRPTPPTVEVEESEVEIEAETIVSEREESSIVADEVAIPSSTVSVDEEDIDEDVRVARDILVELLEKMQVEGTVEVLQDTGVAEDENGSNPTILNVTGKQMRVLIGRRGETLSSLQYIVRLIVSRRLQRRANFVIDVDNYRLRRSEKLEGLAHRMADLAVRDGRRVTLEPMPANERRIIHIALRTREDVETESIGEGRMRKVTIMPIE